MRVLVTGGTGFIGSHTVEALVAAGHEPRLLVRSPDRAEAMLATRGVDPGAVELVTGDIRDAESVRAAVAGCDAVIHAAASVAVTGRDEEIHAINVEGTRHVLDAAVAAGCDPIVHLSSVAVFIPTTDAVLRPDSALAQPRNPYGQAKLAAERYARSLQQAGHPVAIVYPGGVIGPDQPALDATMEGIRAALTSVLPVPRGGVPLIDVRDLAVLLVATLKPGKGVRRLMAGGRFLSWTEFAAALGRVTGRKVRTVPMPARVLLETGRALDALKRRRPIDYPLTYDAAQFMTGGVPTDDTPTLTSLGVTLRPTDESLADSIRWLVASGHLKRVKAGRLAP